MGDAVPNNTEDTIMKHESLIRTFLAAHISMRRIGRSLGIAHTTVARRMSRDLKAEVAAARAEIVRADRQARQQEMGL